MFYSTGPGVIFAGKARSIPWCEAPEIERCRTLVGFALPVNIFLGWISQLGLIFESRGWSLPWSGVPERCSTQDWLRPYLQMLD
jgi:hypothetical protein